MTWIYSRSKTGKVRIWRTWTEGANVCTEYGEVGGALQRSSYLAVPVNVGKKNERNAEAQAEFESDAMRRKKLETGWAEEESEIDNVIKLPMLAEKLNDHAAKIKGTVLVQPKLNGVRCHVKRVDEEQFVFSSRKGKPYRQMWHLIPFLKKAMQIGEIFDGELYKHGVALQTISGLVRKKTELTVEEAGMIELHVYDVADEDLLTGERNDLLYQRLPREGETEDPVRAVRTYEADDLHDIKQAHDQFVQDGYEGAMIRLPDMPYEFNSRSVGLLKMKEFEDDEFEIIGFKQGVGRYDGAIVFRCITKDGKEFDVKPRGPISSLREMWDNRETYTGKMLTVRYQSMTPAGAPEFPVGITVRDYE